MSGVVFRYAHLSDLHLCVEPKRTNVLKLFSRQASLLNTLRDFKDQQEKFGWRSLLIPSSYDPCQLSGLARFCHDHANTLDGIIVSGDVCTTGMMQDIQVGKSFLTDPPSFRSSILTEGGGPTIERHSSLLRLIPGNHDRYTDNNGTPNGTLFELSFASFLQNSNNRFGHWIDEKSGRRLAFIWADFSIRKKTDVSARNLRGRGKVYEDILSELVGLTRRIRSEHAKIEIIWLIHFAPYDCGTFLLLEEAEHLLAEARREGIKLIWNGHTHESKIVDNEGVYSLCAGSATAVDVIENNSVHIVELTLASRQTKITRHNYIWDAKSQSFKKSSSEFRSC